MLLYLLKSAACLAAFMALYKLLLEREPMHQIKRFYLLAAIVLSFAIPQIIFVEYVEMPANSVGSDYLVQATELGPTIEYAEEEPWDWWQLVLPIYLLGFVFFTIRFVVHLSSLVKNIRNNPKVKTRSWVNVLLEDFTPPYTFLHYIFLNKKRFENKAIPEEVLRHEAAHVNQKHSLDVLFIELLQIIFWFNPLIFILKKWIKLNHEFLADQAVLKQGTPTNEYQHTLLKFASSATNNHQLNRVYSSIGAEGIQSIKKRFIIMKKKSSKKSLVLRSSLVLPLTTFLLFALSTVKEVYIPLETSEDSTEYYARSLSIEILGNDNYSVEGINVDKNNFLEIVNEFNTDINTEIRNKILNIHLSSSKDIPKSEVWFIYNSLFKYGFYRIVGPNQEIIREKGNTPISIENNYLSGKEVENYNVMATKYNAIPLRERKIPLNDLRTLEVIYKKMSASQKEEAQPFPECYKGNNQQQQTIDLIEIAVNKEGKLLVIDKLIQLENLKKHLEELNTADTFKEREKSLRVIITADSNAPKEVLEQIDSIISDFGATTVNIMQHRAFDQESSITKNELKEYNSLAKKYNRMLEKKGSIRILKRDVDRMEYLFSNMSEEQRANAEPFPNFPEPPAPPTPPSPPEEAIEIQQEVELATEINENVVEEILIKENASDTQYANYHIEKIIETQDPYDNVHQNAYNLNTNHQKNDLNTTWSFDMQDENVNIYLNGTKISYHEFVRMQEEGEIKSITVTKNPKGENSINIIELNNSDSKSIKPAAPTAPPKPLTPIEHVQQMAKKGATFIFKGKEISSEKAISLLKKNKSINIDSRNKKGEKPVLRLSEEPIRID
ncbi:M56 family metallopeptidase [Pseudozobellia sp. WGM2]|uniref:M56 family metallopeptidase n=1 Tax=Pseudozobellia sp. WGM2 TaxID=2787625 RepID=UPI001ADED7E6|nr:M56 family metallopeptidase [Pseudozobellia sp. WGM2]